MPSLRLYTKYIFHVLLNVEYRHIDTIKFAPGEVNISIDSVSFVLAKISFWRQLEEMITKGKIAASR